MRDLVFLGLLAVLAPLGFFKPFYGILVWNWISFMNPHRLTYSAYTYPVAMAVGIPTLIGFFREIPKVRIKMHRELVLIFMLWVMFTVINFNAYAPILSWVKWEKISKILLMAVLTVFIVDTPKKLRLMMLVISLSLGFYGLKGGIFTILTGGNHKIFGPPDTFIGDNNALGLAMNMNLPLLLFLALEEKVRKLRILLFVVFFFSIISIIFTYSRGAFVGLVPVALLLFAKVEMKIKHKVLLALILAVALPVAFSAVPKKWFDRMETIENYEKDPSAMSRLEAWETAWDLALKHPLFGGGFQAMERKTRIHEYNPNAKTLTDVHSVYFEALGEGGFITFGLFILLLFFSLLSLRRMRKQARKLGEDTKWIVNYTHMVETSLVAYMICGTFLELLTFDLFWTMVAAVICMKNMVYFKVDINGEPVSGNSALIPR